MTLEEIKKKRIQLYNLLEERVLKGYDTGDLVDVSDAVDTLRALLTDIEIDIFTEVKALQNWIESSTKPPTKRVESGNS